MTPFAVRSAPKGARRGELQWAFRASFLALLCMGLILFPSSSAHAWTLVAVVKDKDGTPKIIGYSFGNDRQACNAAMEAIKKMQPDAVIVKPCTPG